MTLTFELSERFLDAAEEWAEQRIMEEDEALEVKVEQALLEIEHLVSGAFEVEFDVEGRTVHYEPSEALDEFLEAQAEEAAVDAESVLRLHVDLFANAFLDNDQERPPNAPPG